ncbi:uncharacterized protein LOC111017712 [Momordica charantia]|uniref:Uncharacterized protein LOC111017712 n=1 Tax=Momordica charantia TaxID=3673 RepID=A0A6J1D577_MOMCH|nr:uncharacterized protein LOC111017712 [Momordica charantia]
MIFAINLFRLPHGRSEIHSFRFQSPPSPALSRNRLPCQISYCIKKLSDAELASDLATEVAKMSTNLIQREEAMKKSKEFLFTELCGFLGLKSEETKKSWKKMDEEAKLALVKEFVTEWGFNFQPLSPRSVKELVEEYVNGENISAISSAPSLIPSLKRIMGL